MTRAAPTRTTGLPALLENDATTLAIGEYWSGGTSGCAVALAGFGAHLPSRTAGVPS